MRWPLPWPRSWRTREPSGDDAGEATGDDEDTPTSLKESAILFARDLGVALLVVVIVMMLLFAYTRVWPPMVVVESGSMQHSNTESFIGVIDTGDLVLVQTVGSASDVTTYVEGRASGYETYGNYGDVIVFHKPSDLTNTETPIIHRAIVYLVPNAMGGFDAPSVARLPATEWSGLRWNGTPATSPTNLTSLTLLGVRAWNGGSFGPQTLTFQANNIPREGFLTHGDHNQPFFDTHGIVAVEKIVGKARGELPWFGLIKLTLARGSSGCCAGWGDVDEQRGAPKNSWDALLVSLIVVIVGPFVGDIGWAMYKDRRKREVGGKPGVLSRLFPFQLKPWERVAALAFGLASLAATVYLGLVATSVQGRPPFPEILLMMLIGFAAFYLLIGTVFGGNKENEVSSAPPDSPAPPGSEVADQITDEARTESAVPEDGDP